MSILCSKYHINYPEKIQLKTTRSECGFIFELDHPLCIGFNDLCLWLEINPAVFC